MKTKIFALFSAMILLVGTTAMAQSDNAKTTETEIKGDVNNDGVVDVADIAAVIAVMHEQGTVETQYYWYVGNENPMNTGMATNIDASALTFTLDTSNSLLQTATSYTDLIGKEFPFPNHFVIPTEWLDKIQIVNMSNLSWAWGTTVIDTTNKYTWCWNSGTGTGTCKIIAK